MIRMIVIGITRKEVSTNFVQPDQKKNKTLSLPQIQKMEKYIIMLSQEGCVGQMATSQIERALKDPSLFFFGELLGK